VSALELAKTFEYINDSVKQQCGVKRGFHPTQRTQRTQEST